jgi:hypothetical protein
VEGKGVDRDRAVIGRPGALEVKAVSHTRYGISSLPANYKVRSCKPKPFPLDGLEKLQQQVLAVL